MNCKVLLGTVVFLATLLNAKEPLLVNKNINFIKQDIIFERFTSGNGLPDNRIRSIYQDSFGFLWIGTMNGLCKYDGHTFSNYFKGENKNSVVGNWTFSICEDSLRRIWIGTLEGLSCIDTESETVTNYQHQDDPNSLSHNEIYSLMFDHYGFLWIGTANGLTKLDLSRQIFKRFDTYPFNTIVTKIIHSQGDYIWMTTSNGVVRYNVTTDEYHLFQINVEPTPYGDKFWSMLENENDLLIATGRHGLLKLPFNAQTNSYDNFLPVKIQVEDNETLENIQVFDICKSKDGDIWLGTENGLAKIENINAPVVTPVFYKNEPINHRSISNNTVYTVYIDETDVLWCGTELGLNKSDLNLLPFQYFTLIDQQSKEQIRTIFSKDAKDIWFGTARKGFFHYNLENKTSLYYHFSPDVSLFNSTRAILYDDYKLWLGTLGGTVNVRDCQYDKEIEGATYAFMKDSKKNLWVGTNKGLYRISEKGEKKRYLHYQYDQISNRTEFIRTIYEDHNGLIWCGFETDGVYLLDAQAGEFTHISQDMHGNRMLGYTIFSILEYPENVIWIGSESGLSKIVLENNGNFTIQNYTEKEGLSDKSISGILPDDNGNLWISTIKGLMKFDIEKEEFDYYLTDFKFSFSCYSKAETGELFFGSDDGFILFNPDNIHRNYHIPKMAITHFKLFNKIVAIGDTINGDVVLKKSVMQTKEIILNYKNNVFSIDFAALHFSDPKKCKFAYILKGFNPDWILSNASDHTATYTNLNAGTYLFMVKTANNSGIWNDTPVELKITILPPPWKTWWAVTLYLLLSVVVIWLIIRTIILQIRQRQQINIERYENQQQLQLNQMKLKFFTDVAHEFRTPLMLITGPVEELLSANNHPSQEYQRIKSIYRNCLKLNYLIDELMTFRKIDQNMMSLNATEMDIVEYMNDIFNNFKLIAEQKAIHLTFHSNFKELFIWIDPKKLEKVFNNLLLNAFKFTKENDSIAIRIPDLERKDNQEYICIEIEDTGKGIAPDDLNKVFERFYQVDSNSSGTGIGLSLTKSLIELHHGFITIESELSNYTRFKIFLPQGDQYLSEEQKKLSNASKWKSLDSNTISYLADANYLPVTEEKHKQLPKKNKLLLVDDNPEVLDFLSTIFDWEYQIHVAENGEKALELIQYIDIDLIISDVMMPVMDGLELCRNLKNDISICHIPIILLTAKSSVEHILEGIEGGADDYIAKPFHPNILKARVSNLIESRKRIIEKFQSNKIADLRDIMKNNMDQEFIQTLLNNITNNINNIHFDVEQLCSIMGMSRSNLFRKLKAITGQNLIEFINTIRMKRSVELLTENKMNISEIALHVGFQNASSFGKAFRQYYKMSPSDYLKTKV